MVAQKNVRLFRLKWYYITSSLAYATKILFVINILCLGKSQGRQRIRYINLAERIRQYWVVHKLPQIYTANHATFPIQIRKITVQICGNFWVTQYILLTSQCQFAIIFCQRVSYRDQNNCVFGAKMWLKSRVSGSGSGFQNMVGSGSGFQRLDGFRFGSGLNIWRAILLCKH